MEKQNFSLGLERMKIDLLFILAGGETVDKDFSYDRQRDYYAKEIFGGTRLSEIIEYGKNFKMTSEYMFPNNPEKIRNRKLLLKIFASCTLLDRMSGINSFTTASDIYQVNYACLSKYSFQDSDMEDSFLKEVRYLHRQYTQGLTVNDYEKFRELMKKYSEPFEKISTSIADCVFNANDNKAAFDIGGGFIGFRRLKADLVFDLVGGAEAQEGFTYEEQLNFYIKAVYGDLSNADEVVNYGKEHRMFSRHMFPNSPENIRSRKLLMQSFAGYAILEQIGNAESYAAVMDEQSFRHACIDNYNFATADNRTSFVREFNFLYSLCTRSLTEKEFDKFKKLMSKFSEPFNLAAKTIKECALQKREAVIPDAHGTFAKLCDRWGISKKVRIACKLRLDSFFEVQIGNTDYADYLENVRHAWKSAFPEYNYCTLIEEYVNQEKSVCIAAFGNKFDSVQDEKSLLNLLASVNIKIALADGARNYDELLKKFAQQTAAISDDVLRKKFNDSRSQMISYYFPDNFKNYGEELREAVRDRKAALISLSDSIIANIVTEENDVAQSAQVQEDIIADDNRRENYETVIAQKDSEIASLQKDLEYYENLNRSDFHNDIVQYDKGVTDVLKKLCEKKFGAPLNELYLMSSDKKELTAENFKAVMQNLLFVLSSLGVNPYEENKIGKSVKFDSEEANIVYAVDEKKLVDGINKGVLKYPGWKYKGEELTLPIVEI